MQLTLFQGALCKSHMEGQLQKCNILFGKLCFKHDLSFWRSSEYGSREKSCWSLMLVAGAHSEITKEERGGGGCAADRPKGMWCVFRSTPEPTRTLQDSFVFIVRRINRDK